MKKHIEQLAAIARKPARTILGLMSGTSLDGLDLALCRISGAGFQTKITVSHFETVPFSEHFQTEIRQIFAQKTVDFQKLVLLNVVVAEMHATIINDTLARWGVSPEAVDAIASHGQTVFHAPRQFHGLAQYPNATLQIGDGDHLALRTGIITLSDFRQKHLAAGGEGAPLALYGDYLLFSEPGEDRFLLNIGGIANFTFLPGNGDSSRVFATDTGPGNTLLDAAAQRYFGKPFDADARLAAGGTVDENLLAQMKAHPYFSLNPPVTTGPEQFSLDWALGITTHGLQVADALAAQKNANAADLMATLTRLTADTIVDSIRKVPLTSDRKAIFLSGGGAHNPLVIAYLTEQLAGWEFSPMADLGVDGDAKEAVLFAILANETLAGTVEDGATLGGLPLVGMGKISLPG
ncbi:MAG: anhydro-N-acetylmuramic acid kinase [Lewinellaceae bacterium]|jgi:anhydro-N-acetylmuramic acid kinase|nr:anhydro-N-acetylmuramic acid kinase [Lewinellaceae bacterium]